MTETDLLAARFHESRTHLRKVALRMLGSASEADDAVQEAWLRVSSADASAVENLGGWLTTVLARVCLDILRSRTSRREDPLLAPRADGPAVNERTVDPEQDLLLGDSIGPALLVVLETLGPAERVAFVLHDLFDLPFEEVATIVGRTPESTRQLASRARRRIRGGTADPATDLERQRTVVNAFLAASRDGDFGALLAVLDPDVRLRADQAAIQTAAAAGWGASALAPEVHGAHAVAETFRGRKGVRPVLIDGVPGAAFAIGDRVQAVWAFTFREGKIVAIDLVMDSQRLGSFKVDV